MVEHFQAKIGWNTTPSEVIKLDKILNEVIREKNGCRERILMFTRQKSGPETCMGKNRDKEDKADQENHK